MLIQLTPDQVADAWESLKLMLDKTLPAMFKDSDKRYLNILKNCMSGTMQIWGFFVSEDLKAVVLTAVNRDPGTYAKFLTIYGLVSNGGLETSDFKSGFVVLREFAKNLGCQFIKTYSQSESMVKLSKRLGADTSWTLINFRL